MEKSDSMENVRDEVLNLINSPLYIYRIENNYSPVIGEGSQEASILFVGEAPGKKEAESARPFCGRSGTFLDEMLSSINLDREKVYIANLVKDRPQDNRDPTREEIDLYGLFLDRQIQIIKPKVVVMLGRLSMNYLFEKAGIKENLLPIGGMHGKPFEGDFGYGSVTLLPLYHPAAALYNPKMRSLLFEDFKKLEQYI